MENRENLLPVSILVVEDDKNILNLLAAYLESAGYKITSVTNGSDGLKKALSEDFDICVLDVMLPDKSGVKIAEAMRQAGCDTPIIFLTALGNEADILRGFDVGADDYMVKPFSPRVLLVRIEAILRRLQNSTDQNIVFGPVQLDDNQPRCLLNGTTIELTPNEYRILRQLLKRPGRVFGRTSLIECIYGNEHAVSPKAIDVHVHHLRTKLDDEDGQMIKTVRGFGYMYSAPLHEPKSTDSVKALS